MQGNWRNLRAWLINVIPFALTVVSALLVLYLLAKGVGLVVALLR